MSVKEVNPSIDEIKSEVKVKKLVHYINLEQTELDIPIYRVFPFDSLLESLIDSKLNLVKTRLWEDPYENYLFKCYATKDGNNVNFKNLQEQLFGQCWSFTADSDAIWRIYSPQIKGVRIKTTIKKLFNVIFDDNSYASLNSSFIGKVKYDSLENIQNYFSNPRNTLQIIKDTTARLLIDAQLKKRNEFIHENEVRILYWVDSNNSLVEKKIAPFSIDPNSLIDEVTFDPRIKDRELNIFTNTVKNLCYNGIINKSDLYDFKPVKVQF